MNPAGNEEVIRLDIVGQICPSCLLVTLKKMNEHRDGLRGCTVRLLVRTDHRDSTRTVPEAARRMGYAAEVRKAGALYEISIGGQP